MATDSAKMRWDMETFFAGGSRSSDYAVFRRSISEDLTRAGGTISALPLRIDGETGGKWRDLLVLVEDIDMRLHHAGSFAFCLSAQDVNDEHAMIVIQELSSMEAELETIKTGIEELAISLDDETWKSFLRDERLKDSSFYWGERRRRAKLKMEPGLEKLATKLAVDGYHAWNRLYSKIAGDLRAEFEEDGETKLLSMGQIVNKMSSPDRDVRRRAFDSLEASWNSKAALAALELNSIAGFRLSLYEARGWDSPLFEPYMLSRVKPETIEAMWKAIAGGLDRITDYVDAKKRILGIDKFRWYDQTAPLGKVTRTYSYGEASDFVIKHLSGFSEGLGDFARMAVGERWVEAEDRSGKAAGGFCTGFPMAKQSRIFMTFSGNYNEMMTLAHELGHAYHSWVFRDTGYYGRHYTMALAETASTFNEMLVTDAALEEAGDTSEKLSLLDSKINEHFTMFCNIRARYLFELRFYDERKRGPVAKERLNEIMVDAQRQAFGDILADDGYHPLFWASKLHFSETDTPFYNFPYTFGHLFASWIYSQAKEEGAAFGEKYRALLIDTGRMTCEDLARKHLDLDLASDGFWNAVVGRALDEVDEFLKLTAV
jgi:oligoendopeptidase F